MGALEAAEGPAQEYAANAALTTLSACCMRDAKGLTATIRAACSTQWSEFLSRGNIIDNSADAYNEQQAALRKKKLSGFPASLIAGLTGVQAEEFSA